MIGKTKQLKFASLFFLISIAILINSYVFKNYYLISFFLFSFFIAFSATKYGLRIIKVLNLRQNIRQDGPQRHYEKKNTPTMGGLFIIMPFLIFLLLINLYSSSIEISLLFLTVLCFFVIGFLDDFLSIKNKNNTGLKSHEKFTLQALIAIIFIYLASQNGYINSNITIFNTWVIDTKIIIFPISFFTLIGLSNAVNLTDGLDGLASGCSSIVFYGLGTEILLKGKENLLVFSLLCFAMSGLCIGFLKFNKYPAKIFMGDSGSLTIGAILGSISILTNSYFSLFIFSGIFIIETLSVIIQVGFFKITKILFHSGRRIFLMTPIHHHYELQGLEEEKIVDNFWKINTILVILGIVLKISF